MDVGAELRPPPSPLGAGDHLVRRTSDSAEEAVPRVERRHPAFSRRPRLHLGDVWFVGEAKSPTAANEATQIRLGIAQLLEYRYVLRLRHPDVKAVLILEREPDMTRWSDLSKSLEIEVVWPGTIDAYLATVV